MITHLRRNAIAYLALFVALGGTGYAVATIGAKDIRPDAIRARHIAQQNVGSLFGAGVAFGTIRDFGPVNPNVGEGTSLPFYGTTEMDFSTDEEGGPGQLLAPVPLRFRDLRVISLGAPLERPVHFYVNNVLSDRRLLSCTIKTGTTRCRSGKPSRVLKAGGRASLHLLAPIAPETLSEQTYLYSLRIVPG